MNQIRITFSLFTNNQHELNLTSDDFGKNKKDWMNLDKKIQVNMVLDLLLNLHPYAKNISYKSLITND